MPQSFMFGKKKRGVKKRGRHAVQRSDVDVIESTDTNHDGLATEVYVDSHTSSATPSMDVDPNVNEVLISSEPKATQIGGISNSWYKCIAELNDGKLRFTQNPMAVSFKYPGLTISQYDREGNPNILFVMKSFIDVYSCGSFIPYNDKDHCFIDWPIVKKNALSFIVSSIHTFSRAFYERELAKHSFDATLSLGHVGNSACSMDVSLFAPGSQDPLASHDFHIVLMDKGTRLPRQWPDWFKKKYKGMGRTSSSPRVGILSKPRQTYHYQVQVMWSGTDLNNHTNYSSYVEYAINGIRYAVHLKKKPDSVNRKHEEQTLARQATQCLKGVTSEILRSGLKTLKICFTRESNEGDELDVHLWQEDGNDFNILCVIELRGEAVCHIQLEYFTVLSSHL